MNRLLIVVVACLAMPLAALAQGEPPTPAAKSTQRWVTAPSVPFKGPIVHRIPGQPGPTPGMSSPPVPKVGITIDGYEFEINPGPCAFKVGEAINAHADLLTNDTKCNELIMKARAIQRQKEAEDPSYAHAPRLTPAPTSEPTP